MGAAALLASVLAPSAWAAVPAGGKSPAGETALPAEIQLHALEVTLNGTALGTWEVLEAAGGFWATGEAMQAWRLLMPASARPVMHRQRLWWPLFALPGYRARLDESSQTLQLEVTPAALHATTIAAPAARLPEVSRALPAFVVNYDLSWTETADVRTSPSGGGVLTEAGLSGDWGVLLSTQVTRVTRQARFTDPAGPAGPIQSRTESRRLETHWTRDWPAQGLTLRLGDNWTTPSVWGRQAAFAGLQLGTNRAFVPPGALRATPVVSGSALTPSTVELYVNEALRQTVSVPAGPFTLESGAWPDGASEARVVVRDVLGRETVIVRPFFTHALLLAPGRSEWSAQAGWLRRGFGWDAAHDGYASSFAQASWRQGLSRALTLETRAQAGDGLTNVGLAVVRSLQERALLQAAIAGSTAGSQASGGTRGGGSGGSALLGLELQAPRTTLGLRAAASSARYRELGLAEAERPSRAEGTLNLRLALGNGDAVGLSAAALSRWRPVPEPRAGSLASGQAPAWETTLVRTASLSYQQRLFNRGSLVWSATRVVGSASAASAGVVSTPGLRGTTLQLMAVLPLEHPALSGPGLLTAQLQRHPGSDGRPRWDAQLGAQASPAAEAGWGWRALAGTRVGLRYGEAGLYRQASQALVSVDLAAAQDQPTALRAGLQGAWVLAEGGLYATRRLQESWALVEVPGQAGVGVSVDGSALAQTNGSGRTLLPRLASLRENRVRLDPNSVAPEAEIDSLEQAAVPPWRSGVKVRFAVREGRAALLAFTVRDGVAAPPGAVLVLEGDEREFFVGRRGEAYVTGLPDAQARDATLHWQGQRCTVQVRWSMPADTSQPSTEPAAASATSLPALPRLGPYRCPELTP